MFRIVHLLKAGRGNPAFLFYSLTRAQKAVRAIVSKGRVNIRFTQNKRRGIKIKGGNKPLSTKHDTVYQIDLRKTT